MTNMKLFSPYRLRGMELRNRVILPAMGSKMATEEGYVSDRLIHYLAARAKGGCGLITTEVCAVHPTSHAPHFLALFDDKYIEGLKQLVEALHQYGAKTCVQLWHGGIVCYSKDKVAPSPFNQQPGANSPRVLTIPEIKEITKAFGSAARRSVESGFDCVELHLAHGYLLEEFLSPHFNKRTDEYGGSFENRARFALEVIEEIRKNIPEEMPFLMRVLPVEEIENGFTHEESVEFCKLAKDKGVDLLNVSRGVATGPSLIYEVPPIDISKGFNVNNAILMKQKTGLPVAAVGRINDPFQAETILQTEKVDMVVIGRAQLADPEFCNKAMNGEFDQIVRCIGCNQGCYDGFVDANTPYISCLRNPSCGREIEYELKQTDSPKTVLIAGGGCAGLEAALTLKKRGHNPIIYDASTHPGGQFELAGRAPRKAEMSQAAEHMVYLATKANIPIHTQTSVTPDLINKVKPDVVIIATGSHPISLPIEGADLPHVHNSHAVLSGKVKLDGQVAIIGGGLVGVETAEKLIQEGCQVQIIEMLPGIASDLGITRKIFTMTSLAQKGIPLFTNSKCIAIKPSSIIIEQDGQTIEIEDLDHVVIAVGAKSRCTNELEEACENLQIPHYVIGDALKARRALNAIHEAAEVARKI